MPLGPRGSPWASGRDNRATVGASGGTFGLAAPQLSLVLDVRLLELRLRRGRDRREIAQLLPLLLLGLAMPAALLLQPLPVPPLRRRPKPRVLGRRRHGRRGVT